MAFFTGLPMYRRQVFIMLKKNQVCLLFYIFMKNKVLKIGFLKKPFVVSQHLPYLSFDELLAVFNRFEFCIAPV